MTEREDVVQPRDRGGGICLIVLGCALLVLGLFAWLAGFVWIVVINLVVDPIGILAGILFLKQAYEPGRKSAS